MPVELRKRKAPQPPPAPAPAAKAAGGRAAGAKAAARAKKGATAASEPKKEAPEEEPKEEAPKEEAPKEQAPKEEAPKEEAPKEEPNRAEPQDEPAPAKEAEHDDKAKAKKAKGEAGKVAVGDVLDLDGFGGEVETHDGRKTSLKQLVDESKEGVVLFTYPKALTPGCTNQACLFRDAYEPLTAGGLAIYGLSSDSPRANAAFRDKQRLPYPLLCDAQATLIAAIGMRKQPRSTQRGVFAVDKAGRVLVAEPGGPAATVDRVKALVEEMDK